MQQMNTSILSVRKSSLKRMRAATALAKRLERCWHDRGYPSARFWVEPLEGGFAKIGTLGEHGDQTLGC